MLESLIALQYTVCCVSLLSHRSPLLARELIGVTGHPHRYVTVYGEFVVYAEGGGCGVAVVVVVAAASAAAVGVSITAVSQLGRDMY